MRFFLFFSKKCSVLTLKSVNNNRTTTTKRTISMGYYDDGGNTMTTKDWDEVDRSSRELLSCLLETQLSAEAVGESHGCCCWDLSCMIRGKKVAVEIKDRRMDHNQFGDILVETSKQECIANKQFDTALAANVFKDQVVCLANLFDKEAKHF